MDPDACYREMIELAKKVSEEVESLKNHALETPDDEAASELAERVLALDGWLKSGGFLPAAWKREA